MKIILCLIGVVTLVLTNGCVLRGHDRGGAYGPQEYQRGQYRSDPAPNRAGGYWDENGRYHEYRGSSDQRD